MDRLAKTATNCDEIARFWLPNGGCVANVRLLYVVEQRNSPVTVAMSIGELQSSEKTCMKSMHQPAGMRLVN